MLNADHRSAMIDGGTRELHAVISKLEVAAASLGLSNVEVAAILSRDAGGWPMPIIEQWAPMEKWQETKLRDLYEVCWRLPLQFGADVVLWLRRSNPAVGMTPMHFLTCEANSLRALREVLRFEQAASG